VKRGRTIALFLAVALLATNSPATSCGWGKKFKIPKVCGVVRDEYGAEIPDAIIQVKKLGSEEIVAESQTKVDGAFSLAGIAKGDYEIRVKVRGFWDASQSFRLTRAHKDESCPQPIRVVMKMQCSYVENAWKK